MGAAEVASSPPPFFLSSCVPRSSATWKAPGGKWYIAAAHRPSGTAVHPGPQVLSGCGRAVPLLTKAASAPWRPSGPALACTTVKFGGRLPPLLMWKT